MAFVAVEDELGNVRSALEDAGYRVVGMNPADLRRAQAVVVSGMDIDMLQQEDIRTDVPVINAAGLSAEEIVAAVRERLK
ncbi:hypothetical protein Tph_c00410 [Thermacetogenium phaeum DSM 12270]|jgi:hypothetical protein|uniref:YkuS family protein n=1 Tax=Thermacetogenium phaeum (strain ATCC BAA-254 / DSM 26808 / PB) TaxID=1089553 RepID=K4LBP0_THEPS|nr:YkuS family protein [Thermacetogenium phaeum]AFV10291.1 hypothetical protein Tph_c00410 [Thermacetogenium phaeum DSM 12270]